MTTKIAPTKLPETVEFKSFHFQLKSFDEDQGIITGYLSTFGNVDEQKDKVWPGAFTKTIQERYLYAEKRNKKALLGYLWMHNPEQPVGYYYLLKEDKIGLYVEAQLDISTNTQGIPNNPLAVMVFSGYKNGYIDEMSIGYEAIQKDYDSKTGIRNLREIRLWEGSAVTMLFAANPEAVATGVKTMNVKTASGKTSWPLADRDVAWDGSAAHNRIVEKAAKEDGSLDEALMKSVHFWYDESAPDKITSYKMLFCDIESDEIKAIPRGIFACAAVLQGSRGGADLNGDDEAVKAKVASYYKKMAKQFDDDSIKVPWEDTGKGNTMNPQRKTLMEHYNEEMAEDLIEDWMDVYINSLTAAIFDAFTIGDQPAQDISEALDAFKTLVLEKFVAQAMECNLSQYIADHDYGFNPVESTFHNGSDDSSYGWMSRREKPAGKASKAGRRISADTQATLEQHQEQMKAALNAMQGHMNTMQTKVSDLTQLWHEEGLGDPYTNDDGKGETGKSRDTRREPQLALTREEQPQTKSTADQDLTIDDLAALLV